jgi:DNA-binding transcriptional LysR family regulator
VPETLADLASHRAVSLRSITTGALTPFEFVEASGKIAKIEMASPFSVTGTESFRDAVLLGLGLGQLPVFHIERDLADGRLVRVLPDQPLPSAPVSILYPRSRQLSPRVRLFIDWAVGRFTERRDAA